MPTILFFLGCLITLYLIYQVVWKGRAHKLQFGTSRAKILSDDPPKAREAEKSQPCGNK